jgi:hypothetical protein
MINKDSAFDLRKAYFQALSGITYNNQAVGVYDEIVPEGSVYPVIVLGNQISRGEQTVIDYLSLLGYDITQQVLFPFLSSCAKNSRRL